VSARAEELPKHKCRAVELALRALSNDDANYRAPLRLRPCRLDEMVTDASSFPVAALRRKSSPLRELSRAAISPYTASDPCLAGTI
jgi:hypothetical protein